MRWDERELPQKGRVALLMILRNMWRDIQAWYYSPLNFLWVELSTKSPLKGLKKRRYRLKDPGSSP